MWRTARFSKNLAWFAVLALLMGACNRGNSTPLPAATVTLSSSPVTPTASPTAFEPSPTPLALAARVNGTELSLEEYQSELARYQAATGMEPATGDRQRIFAELVDGILLAQAAAEQGYVVDQALLDERIEGLTTSLGSTQALTGWMAANGYVEATFRAALARSLAAAWMRDQIAAGVPAAAEQVHARQILLFDAEQANQVLARLEAGADFARLAEQYDPVTQGDLGWFPRGYLTDPKLDQAIFNLEPDQYSGVIDTLAGYHIIQVIERDPQRPLEPDALLSLQSQAVLSWLEGQRSQSDIQILLP